MLTFKIFPAFLFLTDSVIASWVALMSSWQCKKRFGNSFSSHGTLCAGSPPDTSILHGDGCQGNSGGGLLCQEESGRWVVAGVVAGGYGCSDPSSPALYTRVSRFRSWIDEVIDTHGRLEEMHAPAATRNEPTRADDDISHDEHFDTHQELKHKRTHQQPSFKNTHMFHTEDADKNKQMEV